MFLPKGYHEFATAASLLFDWESNATFQDLQETLGGALASGELVAHGIVLQTHPWQDDCPEAGEIRQLRPETWRAPGAREAMIGKDATNRLAQDGYLLRPVIQCTAFSSWTKPQQHVPATNCETSAAASGGVPGLSSGAHALPSGYISFDAIGRVARVWADSGKIDRDLLYLLDPPDTDSMTQALATGNLRAFGISRLTGKIIALPASVWRMEVAGAPQSIWAIGGHDVFPAPDGEACMPALTRADLARCLGCSDIPPDPSELPEDWTAAVPLVRISSDTELHLSSWMHGMARGFKILGKTLKRDDAIAAATVHLQCTTRQAEQAFEGLPHPELRNPPRSAAA